VHLKPWWEIEAIIIRFLSKEASKYNFWWKSRCFSVILLKSFEILPVIRSPPSDLVLLKKSQIGIILMGTLSDESGVHAFLKDPIFSLILQYFSRFPILDL
jgi:hypothetical protein